MELAPFYEFYINDIFTSDSKPRGAVCQFMTQRLTTYDTTFG